MIFALFVWSLALVVYVALFLRVGREYRWRYGTRLWRQAWACFALAVFVLALRRTFLAWFPTIDAQPWFHVFNAWSQVIDAVLLYVFVWRFSTVFHFELPILTEPDAVIGIDHHSMIRVWSPEAETLFGWTAEEVVGQKTLMQTIIRPQEWEAHRYGMARFQSAPDPARRLPRTFRVHACTKDGQAIRVSITVTGSLAADGTWQFQGVIQRLKTL